MLLRSLVLASVLGCSATQNNFEAPSRASGDTRITVASTASPDLPIPADYVDTPNGYFHHSCVVEVGEGETVVPGEFIKGQDGSIKTLPPCPYPILNRH